MKVAILMPTFNDASCIASAIESVIKRSYSDWELLIFDDASEDDTKSVVLRFEKDPRIRYFRGECNQDQLNALYQLIPYVTGEVVTLLHSDNMFRDENVLERIIKYFKNDENLEGVYADLLLVDNVGNFKGFLKSSSFLGEKTIMSAFLALGANLVNDVFCVRKKTFLNHVVKNYVLWNTFYWLKFENRGLGVLNLLKVEPWYQYRIGDNYLTMPRETRRAFVLSGCYRTLVELSRYYCVNWNFSFVHRLPKVRGLMPKFPGAFIVRVSDSLKALFSAMERNSLLLRRLLASYKITNSTLRRLFEGPIEYMICVRHNKTIADVKSVDLENQEVLFGKDARLYYERVLSEGAIIPPLYRFLLTSTKEIRAVRVSGLEDVKSMRNVLRFLNLPLPILVGNEENEPESLLRGFQRRFLWE
ncbi:MAG: glycosyltransferase family 2 protein [Candidatus Atribacteria bacterium]|nr:glycosyltransferase family 2 protein [Candidatus Atribacteria bacterium]